MRRLLGFFVLLIPFFYIDGMVRTGVEIEVQEEYPVDDEAVEVIWTGPGVYYGVYINDEPEYRYWHRRHYYRYSDGRHRGGHHGRHHGGHHGRHHGGGHHGGRR